MNVNTYKIGSSENRPWGSWEIYDILPEMTIKKLQVLPGQCISYQYHNFRSEQWIVLSGVACVTLNESDIILHQGDSINIPSGCRHRLANKENHPLIVLEVQRGKHLSEDDIVRLADEYGRLLTS